MKKISMGLGAWGIALFLFGTMPVSAAPIGIMVDTSSLSGTSALLAFDLIDGGPPANTVTISDFTTTGVLGSSSSLGDITGNFPGTVTFSDTSFFNEYLQQITLGSLLRFTFDTTENAAGLGAFPDGFSFFLLNSGGTASLVSTTDPTGADSLFGYDIGEANPLQIYTSNQVTVSVVALPRSLVLVLTSLVMLAIATRVIRPRQSRAIFH